MATDLMFILVMLRLFQVFEQTRGEEQLYMSDDKSTWLNASDACALGTPSVNFNTYSIDIPYKELTEDLWVGYYVASVKFEFVGCIHKTRGFKLSLFSGKSLSRCFSSCDNAPYFGLSNTSCFCFDKKPKNISQELVCGRQCKRNSCNPCKGDDYMTLYSLYSNNDQNVQFVSTNIFKRSDTLYTWFNSVCPKGSNKTVTLNRKDFVKATFAIFKYDETSAATTISIPSFGYIDTNSSDDQTVLRFKTSSEKLRALCGREMESNTSEGDSSSVYIGVSIVAAVCVIFLAVSFVILKRRKRIPTFCIGGEAIKNNETTNFGIASRHAIEKDSPMNISYEIYSKNVDTEDEIYIASHYSSIEDGPNCKTRQNIKSVSKEMSDVNYSFGNEPSNNDFDQPDEDDDPDKRHYFNLEKIESGSIDSDLNKDCTGIKNLSDVMNNEENVYNRLNEANKETHDNVYDTTKRKQMKRDKTYDITENIQNRKGESVVTYTDYSSVETVDGEYSHIGKKQIKHFKTDNVYGMPQKMSDQHADKEGQENTEAYSHLNMTAMNKNKTDNVYGYNKT